MFWRVFSYSNAASLAEVRMHVFPLDRRQPQPVYYGSPQFQSSLQISTLKSTKQFGAKDNLGHLA